MDYDEEESALCRNYPYPLYYVQSPSTTSDHAPPPPLPQATLSRYSSRGSTNNHSSLLSMHQKTVSYDDVEEEVDHHNNGDAAEEEELSENYSDWKRMLSIGYSNSGAWMFMQITWRLLFSVAVALVVFYVATKPPSPNVSLKIVGMREWGLGEGVDGTGVSTKMLSCNCSIDLMIDNKSKLFGLHIHPPISDLYFGKLPFATSQPGKELYAASYGTTLFKLFVGTRNKPMYGAGRAMAEMLDSREGLPVVVRVRFVSWFRVVWGLIRPTFHHQAHCLVFLSKSYNNKRRTQIFNTTSCVFL